MLELRNVDTYYGPSHVLRDVTLEVNEGEIVCLLGANAAGKTTTMKTIFGLVKPRHGTVSFKGERIDNAGTDQVILPGLTLVPQARRVFSRMTGRENLEMGAFMLNDRATLLPDIDRVYSLYTRLKERDR